MEADAFRQFNVSQVGAEQRLRYWEDVVAKTTSPIAFSPEGEDDFRSSMIQGSFQRFTYSQVDSSALNAFRGKEHTRNCRGFIHLCLQLSGSGEIYSNGETRIAGENSLILYDEATLFRFKSRAAVRTIAVGFPASLVMARLPAYRDIVLRPMDGTLGINQVLHASMLAMDRLFAEHRMRYFSYPVFLGLIDLLAASIEEAGDCRTSISTMAAWAGKIRAHVEANLDDPNLSPASIASQFGISPRYLRLIFAEGQDQPGGGETLRRFILRRRLEECAIMLALPEASYGSITTLAYNWGFSDSSYFARRFVEHYGLTPRDYRAEKMRQKEREQVLLETTS
ncbi:helix-turn-helix domain-containing protein [Altererythrobacter xixiisoli]|uniref:Helix-turn-helix domain-containing protein n=1 Tax=Croceibacterium xixiisoli TaxID=1476466 RepID=A0A6I4U0L1_9SPHN|nr:helix-turn-helix domain-containing protein [Croceibacterium xixiisoli]MXP00498.1 helix-turn-helix domain-containing protein [Croceibacterium xixiisoli]